MTIQTNQEIVEVAYISRRSSSVPQEVVEVIHVNEKTVRLMQSVGEVVYVSSINGVHVRQEVVEIAYFIKKKTGKYGPKIQII